MPQVTFKDYLKLTKPGVTSLVSFSTLTSMLIVQNQAKLTVMIATVAAVILGSGGAAAFNMWYERDLDAMMTRTKNRPVAAGHIKPKHALIFSIVLSLISLVLMALLVNWLATILLACTTLFYCVVYTMILKRYSNQNIVIGGIAGAMPPLIGCAAATGKLGLQGLILFALIFFWTPAHFWALAIYLSEDYKIAKVPMLPNTDGFYRTKKQILYYTILTYVTSLSLYACAGSGIIYLISSTVLGAVFIIKAITFLNIETGSKQLFKFSIHYLFLLFIALIIDHWCKN